jgi:3-hydroxyacyl-CoA dehydrogenase
MAIQKVAVLGAGVMGAQLAAHLANASIPSYLFDLTPELGAAGLKRAQEIKPAAFYHPGRAKLIQPLGLDGSVGKIGECDWILEAVTEKLDLKRGLYEKVLPHLKPGAIITSNTSGISLKVLADGLPADVQRRFFITHFFNPPRYLHLCEIVTLPKTDAGTVEGLCDFIGRVLGKGVVRAKDTPNFIANRIGVFGMMLALELTRKYRLCVEDADAITGRPMGRPKSATYRTADLVGLDTLYFVAKNSYDILLQDEARGLFKPPAVLEALIQKGALGQKSGAGFYKKNGKEILSLDLEKMEYKKQGKSRFDGIKAARRYADLKKRIHALVYSPDTAGKFAWDLTAATLLYAARRIPEIADSVVEIDNAMKWGFGWDLGPFELWDAIGFEKSLLRMEAEGRAVPGNVRELAGRGAASFYGRTGGQRTFLDLADRTHKPVPEKSGVLLLDDRIRAGGEILKNWNASLVDLGDGVACLQFHSVLQSDLHPIDAGVLDMLGRSLSWVLNHRFKGLVLGHQGVNFCAGANLELILGLAKAGRFDMLGRVSKTFQDLGQRIKYAPFPVVGAPRGLTLGGGFEMVAPTARIVALAETYCGAVEVGVGLIPGAGGNLRVLENFQAVLPPEKAGPFPAVQKAFETIAFGKVGTSAEEAVDLGYFRKTDTIVLSPERHLADAKAEVVNLASDFVPPEPPKNLVLPGEGGYCAALSTIEGFLKLGKISKHDARIAKKLARVLTGGEKANGVTPLDEQYILDLERETFLSLAGEPKSQERMAYMLKEGKPLRN